MSNQLYTKQQITDSQLNHSPAKHMYSFSRAERFPPLKRIGYSDNFYTLPPLKHPRGASFGYGKKYDFTKSTRGNQPAFYNGKRDYDPDNLKGPSYTFGMSRDKFEKVYYKTNKTIDKSVPGAGKYLPKIQGTESPKYTMGVRYSHKITKKTEAPGPGAYSSVLQISPKGKYPSSRYRNVTTLNFGLSNSQRFESNNKKDNSMLLSADIGWSKHFNSRYKSSHDIVILGRPKEKNEKSNYPGPGAYNVFSEFSMYGPKVAKTEPITARKRFKDEEIHEEDESKVEDKDNENNNQEEDKKKQEENKAQENNGNNNNNEKQATVVQNNEEQQFEDKEQ